MRWLYRFFVRKMERSLGVKLDYAHYLAEKSPRALRALGKLAPLSRFRRALPPEAWHVAGLVSSMREDCGTCVQIHVNLAVQDGMKRDWLDAVLRRAPEELPPHLHDVYRFAESILDGDPAQMELREDLRKLYGDEGLVELSFAISGARIFPAIKKTLGFAVSCSRVEVRYNQELAAR